MHQGLAFVQPTEAGVEVAWCAALQGSEPDPVLLPRSALPILGYAAIAATVGMILRALQERSSLIGKLVAGALGVA